MPRKKLMDVDLSEVYTLTGALGGLNKEFNTSRHLNVVTKSAFEVLSDEFNKQTHAVAAMAPNEYHHVYEWEHIGIPGFGLWRNVLSGRGGTRRVTWEWRASKTTVPTTTNPDGTPKFKTTDKFDPERLNRIHVFVWKAPMMEYNVTVTVRPKLSHVLVFPNREMVGVGGRSGPSTATFTPHFYSFSPGGYVQGNFTAWFIGWWGGGLGQNVLDKMFNQQRNTALRKSFNRRMAAAPKTARGTKTVRFVPDGVAAKKGRNIARAIASDMEHEYLSMARRRKGVSDRKSVV